MKSHRVYGQHEITLGLNFPSRWKSTPFRTRSFEGEPQAGAASQCVDAGFKVVSKAVGCLYAL